MQLTPQQVTRVLQLQDDFQKFSKEIAALEEMATPLATDPCDITVSLNVHNTRQHKENEQQVRVNTSELGDAGHVIVNKVPGLTMILPPSLAAAMGLQMQTPNQGLKECRTILKLGCTESSGIRILNAILQEKYEGRDLAQKELESILIPKLTISIENENPIHSLYERRDV
jgi:hypothetical protein